MGITLELISVITQIPVERFHSESARIRVLSEQKTARAKGTAMEE